MANTNAASKNTVVLDMQKRHYDQIVRVEKDEFLALYNLFVACFEADKDPCHQTANGIVQAYKQAMKHYDRM